MQLPLRTRCVSLVVSHLNILTLLLATSVDVECVFSKGRLLLSHVRNRLSVELTRALLCLGNWSKAGLVKNEDIQATAHLPDVKEGEDQDLDEDI